MAAIILAVLGVGTLVPYIIRRIQRRNVEAIILKVSTSVLFLLAAMAAILRLLPENLYDARYLLFSILAGQILGLLGDYWLDMKDMHTKHHDTYIFAGFTSFLIGHLFFIAGLYAVYGFSLLKFLVSSGVGAVMTLVVFFGEKPMKLTYGKFKGISVGYSGVFGFVVATAFLSAFYRNEIGVGCHLQALVMAIGLVIFLMSDLVLSGTFFGENKKRPIDYTMNYVLYYGGQFTIALSILALGN